MHTAPSHFEAPVAKLSPSPLNPRKTIRDLSDLTASVKSKGVLQSLLVRPLEGKKGGLEIICGERRWRAAQAAGLATVPVILREDLDDSAALEAMVIENSQRADVHPLEEADGIAALRDLGRSIDEIGAKLGRPSGFVYRRLALLELGDKARKLFLAEKLTVGAAEALATIKGSSQDRALDRLGTPGDGESPIGKREMLDEVKEYRLELAGAPWKLDDAELVAAAGACSSCPKRSGAQPALFEDEDEKTRAKDRCLDSGCWGQKKDAHGKQLLQAAKANGQTILSQADAKKLWPNEYSRRAQSSELVALDDGSDYYGHGKPWRQVLGKKRMPADVVLAKNPHTGDVVEFVKRRDVVQALAASPKKGDPSFERPGSGYQPSAAEKKRKLVAKAKVTAHKRAADELREKLAQPLTGELSELLVLVGAGVLEKIYYGEAIERCAARRGWSKSSDEEPSEVMLRAIAGSSQQMTAVIVELLVESQLRELANSHDADDPESFVARVMAYVGVDWLAHEKTALEELEAKLAKKAKKKAAKKTAAKRAKAEDAGDEADE